jgi:excisionase family DNA binding protein
MLMARDRVPLFVRLPRSQAAALDRLADTTGQHKQHLVSELLADRLQVGHIDIDESPGVPVEVLTLDEVAVLLRLPIEPVETLAREGALPGRQVAGEWRFARSAVLSWLSRGEHPENPAVKPPADGTDD